VKEEAVVPLQKMLGVPAESWTGREYRMAGHSFLRWRNSTAFFSLLTVHLGLFFQ